MTEVNEIDRKREQMLSEPVEKLICKMAIPATISMLVTALYNLADTFFVGQIGSNTATGAVGIVFSYMTVIQAVGYFFGHGSGNYISREIGKKNYKNASEMAATGFFMALFLGVGFMLCGLVFRTELAYLLGSTNSMIQDTVSYLTYILLGTPYMMAAFVLNNQLRLQGNSLFGMIGLTSGAVLNIILDPLLIFSCKMGIAGAALATIISQFVSFIALLVGCQKSSNVTIKWKDFKPSKNNFKEIVFGGFPSLGRQGLASISMLLLNRLAGSYGDAVIASFAVVTKIINISSAAILGFGHGFQPVCGYNYGAEKYDRVKKGFWFSVKIATISLIVIGILLYLNASNLVRTFRDDPEVIEIGVQTLRYQLIAVPFLGWVIVVNMFLQNIRKVVPASIVAMARQGIVFIPLLLVLYHFFGLTGLELTQPISDIITFAISVPFGVGALRNLRK